MDTKLTLSLNAGVIEKAKVYAKSNQVSLSKLIENYLSSLTEKNDSPVTITPLVQSLSGVINADELKNINSDYTDYLAEKYK
ncbi:MAG: hypothetical protein COW03_06975 [Cytophagales bacterium CG12_big_fil_rev_8_21_14_0_65_40_12]|nr:MAG: hypothetical protein COW03_06975 [Cytophagales bacterium CG12_big_fil_rev_8_21_14_0_65_40_12]PIW02856.1 MAG: hypothetical protein COW40_17895 [Cytophagales bacterium CG17_big_fil_post_rev_8_21_14_2_50_40_13]